MEKISFSIIGTCVSRELFNTVVLSEFASVNTYIFQRCLWDMAAKGTNVSREDIDKIQTEPYTARMLYHSFNKTYFDDLREAGSEYLLIDLYNIRADVIKVLFKGNEYYFQNTTHNEIEALNKAKQIETFEDMNIEVIGKALDDFSVASGLEYFAGEIKKIYSEEKIIINIPRHSEKYYKDGALSSYPDNVKELNDKNDALVEKWSSYLCRLLPKAKIFSDGAPSVGMFSIYDKISSKADIPPAIHYSKVDLVRKSYRLLEMLGVKPSKSIEEYLSIELMKSMDAFMRLNSELNSFKKRMLTLNNYFEKIENKSDFIIIITVKDDASNSLKYFRNRSQLPLSFKIGFRDSYIAIVDKKRNFVYEKISTSKLEYEYEVENFTVRVKSAGWLAGNESFVSTDCQTNLSQNRRGMNIVVLNSVTLELVDSANCDSFGDKELKVVSKYFVPEKMRL